MSVIDRALQGLQAGSTEPLTLSVHDAMAALLSASVSVDGVPPELHAPAFAIAVDLVLCDGRVEAREKAYIDSLQSALGVDDATALKIVAVMILKNRA